MTDIAYKAIADRRKSLADRLALLQEQLQPLTDAVATRQAEIDGVVSDIAELDSWLVENPAAAKTKALL